MKIQKKYRNSTYLCLKPILFGNDSLEHKMPLSRGGTNEYSNLAVAHGLCNSKKHAKTENESSKSKYPS
jgi:5-methylcytosine-specific restriction endonuclease McrA